MALKITRKTYKTKNKAKTNSRNKIEIKDENGDTLLHIAAWYSQYENIEYLILQGSNVNAINNNGETPLHKAAWHCEDKIIKLLLKYGADANAKDKNQLSVLHRACRSENFEILTLLVKYGADVNAKYFGETILHKAVWYGQINLIKWLLKQRVNTNLRDNYGKTALHNASRLINFEIYKILLEYGADVTAIDYSGNFPIINN